MTMAANKVDIDYIIIGRITKPHGIRGAFKIEPITEDPNRYELLEKIWIGTEDRPVTVHQIDRVQYLKKHVILYLADIHSREQVENFRNQYIFIPRSDVLPLEDSHYYFELLGLKVYTDNEEFVGYISDIQNYPANDVFVVTKDKNEYLIPDVPEFIKKIDIDAGTLVIQTIPGLLD